MTSPATSPADDAAFSKLFELPTSHPFSWESVMKAPKAVQPPFSHRGDWFKTLEYGLLHTGGFLRLCTDRGRVYWVAQNEQEHITPDWKLHFSCTLADIPRAWNILSCIFMQKHCEIGMKATLCTEDEIPVATQGSDQKDSSHSQPASSSSFSSSSSLTDTKSSSAEHKHKQPAKRQNLIPDGGNALWSARQRGRELTVYIFHYDHSYKHGPMEDFAPDQTSHLYRLGMEVEAGYDAVHWFGFIREAERRFKTANIRSNEGVADGDLALPGCRYASLRNEAYVIVPHESLKASPSSSSPVSSSLSSSSSAVSPSAIKPKKNDRSKPVGELMYPPNFVGWNAAGHHNPLARTIECLHIMQAELEYMTSSSSSSSASASASTVSSSSSTASSISSSSSLFSSSTVTPDVQVSSSITAPASQTQRKTTKVTRAHKRAGHKIKAVPTGGTAALADAS